VKAKTHGTSSKENVDFDVVVVGAGVAGLAAACRLSRSGKRVVVVEGRDRIGGRILNESISGWPVPAELGAEFIHGGNAVLTRWIRRAHLRTAPVEDEHWWISPAGPEKVGDAWEKIDGVMEKIGPKFRGSFASWMERHRREVAPDDLQLAATFVEGFQGAPIDRMSAPSLFQATQSNEEQARIVGGYSRLLAAMLRELKRQKVPIVTRQVVREIEWRRRAVRLRSRTETWTAKAVIVTLPLGVLRAKPGETGAVRFVPALKPKEKLWRTLPIGHALRVVIRFRSDFWTRGVIPKEMRANGGRAFGFLHSRERFFPVWWSKAPAPILVGWTGGPAAEELSRFTPRAQFREARRTLAALLGCLQTVLGRAVVDFRIHDWTSDPLTRGAYSFSVAREEDAPTRLARAVDSTLFFAGEATADPLELGTVQGALASGERAAGELLRSAS
jgi:monoamine oxidase